MSSLSISVHNKRRGSVTMRPAILSHKNSVEDEYRSASGCCGAKPFCDASKQGGCRRRCYYYWGYSERNVCWDFILYLCFFGLVTAYAFSISGGMEKYNLSDLLEDLLLREEFPSSKTHILKTYHDVRTRYRRLPCSRWLCAEEARRRAVARRRPHVGRRFQAIPPGHLTVTPRLSVAWPQRPSIQRVVVHSVEQTSSRVYRSVNAPRGHDLLSARP